MGDIETFILYAHKLGGGGGGKGFLYLVIYLHFVLGHLILHAPGGSYCTLLISSNLTVPSSNILWIKVF